MKKYLFVALILALTFGFTFGPSFGPSFAMPGAARATLAVAGESTPAQRHEAFEIVWHAVKEKHFDATLGGLDWDKVKRDYAPKVDAAKSDNELYSLLQQMLGELHQSHFNIIPPEFVVEDDTREPADGGIGIDIRTVDDQILITRVDPNSPGAKGGLRTGFVITAVDNTPVKEIISRFAKSKESPAITKLRINRSILSRINGPPDTQVKLAYLDGHDKTQEATIGRERLPGKMSQRIGNFPPQYSEIEVKRLEGGIGYIRFNIFVMLLNEPIREAIRSLHDAPGLIIDIRGNPGGVGGIAPGLVGMMEEKQVSLGTMKTRNNEVRFIANPQPNAYAAPIALLIDGMSASTSEILAGGLQELKRAVVVGERSAGAALPSVFEKLPTGALFQYAIGDFRTPSGVLIEGQGVKPDVEVKLSRAALLAGRDPQLDEAVKQIIKAVPNHKSRTASN